MSFETGQEALIHERIEQWAKAVREKNMDAILSYHSNDIVMYDVPEPFQSVGIHAYRKTWETFFEWAKDFGVFDIKEMHVVAGEDVAFCYAAMKCAGSVDNSEKAFLDFRLTVGLEKINSEWIVVHEHHSIPAPQ